MHPYTSYIVCATPRCGSTLLCESLKNTGIAGQPEEYFGLRDEYILQERWGTSNYTEYLASVRQQGTTPNGVFGAKLMWLQMHYFTEKVTQIPMYKALTPHQMLQASFPNLHYIWVWRRDKVRQAISHSKARQTNIWRVTEETAQLPENKATFSFKRIDYMVHEMELHDIAWQKFFEKNCIQPLEIVYEDYISTYEQTNLQVLKYLDIALPESFSIAPSRLKRQSDSENDEWVQRYHDLKARRKRYYLFSLAQKALMPIVQNTKIATFISKKRAYINR